MLHIDSHALTALRNEAVSGCRIRSSDEGGEGRERQKLFSDADLGLLHIY